MNKQSHICILEAEHFRIEYNLQRLEHSRFIFTQVTFHINLPDLELTCLNTSIRYGIQATDLLLLIDHLQKYMQELRKDTEKTFAYTDMSIHYTIEGLGGYVSEAGTDGGFELRFMIRKNFSVPFSYGVEGYISFSNVERFIAELSTALADFDVQQYKP